MNTGLFMLGMLIISGSAAGTILAPAAMSYTIHIIGFATILCVIAAIPKKTKQ